MSYIGNTPGISSQRFINTYTASQGQTVFNATSGYALGYIDVYVNGVKLSSSGNDYTATNGISITLTQGASANDVVELVAYLPRGLSDGYLKSETDTLLAAKQNSLGYTPVNKTGDTITGRTIVSVSTGKQLTIAQWGDASSADGGQAMVAGNAYFDKSSGAAKFSNSHGTIGAVGIRFNSPSWNEGSLFTAGVVGSTADASFTPVDALKWDSSGRVTMPYQPAFRASGTTTGAYSDGAKIPFTTVGHFDRGNNWNNSTSVFTAPVAGVYIFFAHIYVWNSTATGTQSFAPRVNNAQLSTGDSMIWYSGAITGGDNTTSGSTLVSLAAGDTFSFHVRTGAPSVQIYPGHSWVHGYLIG